MHIAQVFSGEIISADSRQVYRFMDIGTSKPSMLQREIIQHHLLDIVDPDGEFTLAQFINDTKLAVSDIRSRDKLPIVVGGTGQYIMAFLEGWQVPNIPPNQILRDNLEKEAKEQGPLHIYSKLQRLDPITASTIDYRNIFVLSFKILKTLLVDFINNFLKKYHTRIIKNFKML